MRSYRKLHAEINATRRRRESCPNNTASTPPVSILRKESKSLSDDESSYQTTSGHWNENNLERLLQAIKDTGITSPRDPRYPTPRAKVLSQMEFLLNLLSEKVEEHRRTRKVTFVLGTIDQNEL